MVTVTVAMVVSMVTVVRVVFGPVGFLVSRVSVLPANTTEERILRRTALSGCHIYLSQIFLHIPLRPKPFMLTTFNNNIVFLYLQYYFTQKRTDRFSLKIKTPRSYSSEFYAKTSQ